MFKKLTNTIKGHAPAIQDIKSFIECFTSQLEGQLLLAESINDQLLLMRSSSNLIDIEMLQGLTEHLQLPDGKEIISKYQEAMMEYASNIPVQLCTTESLNTIMTPPPLKCESATFAFSWKPKEKKLKDAVDIVSKSTGKLMKVRSIELSGDEVHVNCVFLYTLMGAAIATVHDNIEVLINDGIVKVSVTQKFQVGIGSNFLHSISTSICIIKIRDDFEAFFRRKHGLYSTGYFSENGIFLKWS